MEINVTATMGICSEFMSAPDGEKGEVSVVIATIKVNVDPEGSKMRVLTGCNLWQSCHNSACWYSLAAREKKKA